MTDEPKGVLLTDEAVRAAVVSSQFGAGEAEEVARNGAVALVEHHRTEGREALVEEVAQRRAGIRRSTPMLTPTARQYEAAEAEVTFWIGPRP